MKRIIVFAILGGVLGIVAGYFVFGSVAGSQVSVQALLSFGGGDSLEGLVRRAAEQIAGIDEIRRNILLTGAVAAGVAGITAMLTGAGSRKGRRRR
ncbi:MAG: hypothetical protein WD492_07020 [Alkalispirochaeta sp.]